jgi:hypothetical protein
MDWLLDLLGYNTSPSPYTREDWLGLPQQDPEEKEPILSEETIKNLENRKTLPKNLQLMLLDIGKK